MSRITEALCCVQLYPFPNSLMVSVPAINCILLPFAVYHQMGLVGELASLKISAPGGAGYSREQLEDRQRQFEWERGNIDYLGIDAFAHIQQKLDETIEK